ncbi:hypothetical protein PROFUN_01157 [Planoprotostelium fungivorum]|uniref:Uncharacterized protein n=1 Tax=Planoprotostelium fungivorum TaxID=1890364 RepID=A0A2P6NCH5_9EUKA|nr:hypothetical protein PROFUN_01157 [Planoprotostelium fungivorum]
MASASPSCIKPYGPQGLSDADRRSVETVAFDGAPLFVSWMDKGKGNTEPELIIIDAYHFHCLQKGKTKTNHLLDLVEVSSLVATAVRLTFRKFETSLFAEQEYVDELITIIRARVWALERGFPQTKGPRFEIHPATRSRNTTPSPPMQDPFSSYLSIYRALCSQMNISPSSTFCQRVTSMGQASCITDTSFELTIDDASGIYAESDSAELALSAIAALKYDGHFKTISIDGNQHKDVVSVLSQVVAHNQSIQTWKLRGITTTEGYQDFSTAITTNESTVTKQIDFETCHLKDKAANAMAECIATISNRLEVLRLSDCSLSSKGCLTIVKAISGGSNVFQKLKTLDLSNNSFNGAALTSLISWFTSGRAVSLSSLLLRNTGVDVQQLCQHLGSLPIEHLDVSRNKIDANAALVVSAMISSLSNLRVLELAACNLNKETVQYVLKGFYSMQDEFRINLDLSDNPFGSEGAEIICNEVGKLKCIHTLKLQHCSLKHKGMQIIFQNLQNMRHLKELDLSFNHKPSADTPQFVRVVIEALASPELSLESLILRGNEKTAIGKELASLFSCLTTSPLLSLDVSGNQMGERPGIAVAQSFVNNQSLTYVNLDGNNLGLDAWNALSNSLTVNVSLKDIPLPLEDIDRLLNEVKDKKERPIVRDRIQQVMDTIQNRLSLHRNESPESWRMPLTIRLIRHRKTVVTLTQDARSRKEGDSSPKKSSTPSPAASPQRMTSRGPSMMLQNIRNSVDGNTTREKSLNAPKSLVFSSSAPMLVHPNQGPPPVPPAF